MSSTARRVDARDPAPKGEHGAWVGHLTPEPLAVGPQLWRWLAARAGARAKLRLVRRGPSGWISLPSGDPRDANGVTPRMQDLSDDSVDRVLETSSRITAPYPPSTRSRNGCRPNLHERRRGAPGDGLH